MKVIRIDDEYDPKDYEIYDEEDEPGEDDYDFVVNDDEMVKNDDKIVKTTPTRIQTGWKSGTNSWARTTNKPAPSMITAPGNH